MTAHALHLEKCSPAADPLYSSFDLHQFANRRNSPVHADAAADGEWTSPGISFEDYSRMSTQTKTCSRRLETPEWAIDQTKLRSVITRYFELRAFGSARVARRQMPGTEQERLTRAQAKMNADKPKKLALLDGLCSEYVTLKRDGSDPARVNKLGQLIEGLDTAICLIDRGPAVFVGMVYFYYALRMDSVGVAEALGVKPPAVRQTLFRMARVWGELQDRAPYMARYRALHGVKPAAKAA